MTTTARNHGPTGLRAVDRPAGRAAGGQIREGRSVLVRAGQIVATELAAALVVIGALGGRITLGATVFGAVVLLAAAWVRLRGRWAYEWMGVVLRHSARRRVADAGDSVGMLLELAGARVDAAKLAGRPSGVIRDGHGCAVLFDLGESAGVLGGGEDVVPAPVSLVRARLAGQLPYRCQVLLIGTRPPAHSGGTLAAASYEQLTGGDLLSDSRAVLAVRLARPDGWTDAELRQGLERVVRALRRGLAPAQPLDAAQTRAALLQAAAAEGSAAWEESWSELRVGETVQAAFRLSGWAGPPDFIGRLLMLPTRATTVALGAGPQASPGTGTAVDLHVRLAASDPPQLAAAVEALHRMVAAHGSATGARAVLTRLDGEQRDGFIATLPLGIVPGQAITGRPGPPAAPAALVDALNGMALPLGEAGLMVGRNRHGDPAVVRLFRSRPTRVLLVGGVSGAQLVAMRALGMGARVVVRTDRPSAWEQLVHRLSVSSSGSGSAGGGISLVAVSRAVRPVAVAGPDGEPEESAVVSRPSGSAAGAAEEEQQQQAGSDLAEDGYSEFGDDIVSTAAGGWDSSAGWISPGGWATPASDAASSGMGSPASDEASAGSAGGRSSGDVSVRAEEPRRLTLIVVDAGPAGVAEQQVESGQAVLVVRDGYSPEDAGDALAADLLMVTPVRAEEAGALGAALGLGEATGWLARMRPGMLALINERAVRWVAVTPTTMESQLVGGVGRLAA